MRQVVNHLRTYKLPIFVKMDCEGAELEIFNHFGTWIHADIKAVSLETHNFDADYYATILKGAGFDLELFGTCPYPLPKWDKTMCGGLVIARR